nr:MAG TPA: hypothetical protein [Caudoviricetes sp.]
MPRKWSAPRLSISRSHEDDHAVDIRKNGAQKKDRHRHSASAFFLFLFSFLHLHFNLIYICKAKAKQKKANESKAKANESKRKQCFYLLCFGLCSLYSLKLLRFRRFA